MAIMFVRAQIIGRGSGRSVVAAAAYRHRTTMIDEQTGLSHRYEGGAAELVHEELALPDDMPGWFETMTHGMDIGATSEVLWNAVEDFEKRQDAQLARELILALPEELSRAENIELVREFVRDNLTSQGMIADWVYHDKDGNPHVHLMMTLRPMTRDGFGPKKVPVLGEDGEPLRVVTPDRPTGKIVYRTWGGDQDTMKAWKIAWAETANKHLALAGFDIHLDGRSYAEQGLDGIAQQHLGPAKAALARSGRDMYFAPANLARRQAMADRLLDEPGLLLKQLSQQRSTFDERDIAKALHRYVDDPTTFSNLRAELMASPELVTLKPQEIDEDTGKVSAAAVFTTRTTIRTEFEMAQSARLLAGRRGFGVKPGQVAAAIAALESGDPDRPFQLDAEQVEAVRHVTGEAAIAAVVGLAGAGKSTLLDAARRAWEGEGRRVLGAALAGKAAEGLQESSGIASRTLAAWELAWSNDRDKIEKGDIFVIDEAGMVSSAQMARILKVIEKAGAKTVLVGDAMQLQPIEAGAAFRAIVERVGFAELAGVRRQREEWQRDASALFARGKVAEALDAYARNDHLAALETRQDAVARIVADWGDARADMVRVAATGGRALTGSELLVLAQTNDDVRALNEGIRGVMSAQGALGSARAFRTARGERDFAAGDRIIFLENARFVEPRAHDLAVQHVKNGMLGTVVSTGSGRGGPVLTVRLDSGRDVVFSEATYSNVDHGYAATIHKSQGTTVDRTFVLATGMMDQHLAYVAMSRHRDRADLYFAKEDFAAPVGWNKASHVDHAAGVTGELLETGKTHYRGDTEAQESPYADVRTEDGSVHRVWGVSLPAALERGGVAIGDSVTLRKDGVEQVKVKIPVVDAETGRKTTEERTVDRNVWVAELVEGAVDRQERVERESHRPEMFGQLVAQLSRSGAKTTTLDFEDEASYRAHIADFRRLRGLDHAIEALGALEANVEERLSWVHRQQQRVAKLWERASIALGLAIEKDRLVSYDDRRIETDTMDRQDVAPLAQGSDAPRYLLDPLETFPRSLEEDARREQLRSARWIEREAVIRAVVARVYQNPEEVMKVIRDRTSAPDIEPRGFAEGLARDPSLLGTLKGGRGLSVPSALRKERVDAVAAAQELPPLLRAHAERFKADVSLFVSRERTRRAHMAIGVPALSRYVAARLSEIEAVRDRGGEGAYKAAFAMAAEDRIVVQEIKAVNEALTNRFGWSAFTSKADQFAEKQMVDRMPEGLSDDRRRNLAAHFEAVRRFADIQHLAEKRDPTKIVAPAGHDPADLAESAERPVLPMIAAVTRFAMSVEEEARNAAVLAPRFIQERSALAAAAAKVWRDPDHAVRVIDDLVRKDVSSDRIASAISNDPAAYGAMRGSDRLVDQLNASGKERRAAIAAIGEVDARLRVFGRVWKDIFRAEHARIEADRERMAIPIPALSPRAEAALGRLARSIEETPQDAKRLVRQVDPASRAEFAQVSRALDARFGPNAVGSGDTTVLNRIPASQRKVFESMQPRLQLLQRAVRSDRAQDIVAERQARALTQARGITK